MALKPTILALLKAARTTNNHPWAHGLPTPGVDQSPYHISSLSSTSNFNVTSLIFALLFYSSIVKFVALLNMLSVSDFKVLLFMPALALVNSFDCFFV